MKNNIHNERRPFFWSVENRAFANYEPSAAEMLKGAGLWKSVDKTYV